MTDLAWLTEALKARTSRRLNRACKRIRKSGTSIPGPTGQVHTASRALAVRPAPDPRYGRPNSRKPSAQTGGVTVAPKLTEAAGRAVADLKWGPYRAWRRLGL